MTIEEVTEEAIQKEQKPVEIIETEQVDLDKDRDFEKEARYWGWVPKDDFRGNPEFWKEAKNFVKDGEEILPIVRAQNRDLTEKLAASEKSFADRIGKMEKMSRESSKRAAKQHEAELAGVRQQQREAAAAGDLEAYDDLSKRETAMREAAPEKEPTTQDDFKQAEQDFINRNSWYNDDPAMQAAANGISQTIANNDPDMTITENLRQTELKVMELFPDKFKTPRKTSSVDSGGVFSRTAKKSGPSAGLQSEELSQARADVDEGLYKTIDEWAEVYNAK